MNDTLADILYRLTTRFRWWIIPMAILFSIGTGLLTKQYYFDRNYRIYFADHNPDLINYKRVTDMYGPYESVIIGIVAKGEDGIFTKENLKAVLDTTKRSWEIPHALQVDSPSTYIHIDSRGDDLQAAPLFNEETDLTPEKIADIRKKALSDKMVVNRIFNEEGNFASLGIRTSIDPTKADEQEAETTEFARKMIADLEKKYPHLDFHLSGSILYNSALKEVNEQEIRFTMPLMGAALLLPLYLVMGSFRGMFSVLFIVGLTTAAAMGLGTFVTHSLNSATATAPLIIMTITVADCVHVINGLRFHLKKGVPYDQALAFSLRSNLSPVFWTSLTTLVGFLNLNFSEIPPYASMGNIAAIGITLGMLNSLITLPALLKIMPLKISATRVDPVAAGIDYIFPFVEKHSRAIVWTFHTLMILAIVMIPTLKILVKVDEFFSENLRIRKDTAVFATHLKSLYQMEYSLESRIPGGIFSQDYLNEVAAFRKYLLSRPEINVVEDLSYVVKQINRKLHSDDPAYETIPASNEEIAQVFLLYEMSLPPGGNISGLVDMKRKSSKLRVTLKAQNSPETDITLKVAKIGNDWLKQNAKYIVPSEATSIDFMMSNLFYRNATGMIKGSGLSYLLVTIGLMIMLRSLRWGFFSLIPNLSPTLLSFGAWAVFVGHVGIAASSVTILTIGIIVDDTVHFISKYSTCIKFLPRREAIRQVVLQTGNAITTTSFILISGFAVCGTSDFQVNSTMGILVAMTILFALLADLFYLPAIMLRNTFRIDKVDDPDINPGQKSTTQMVMGEQESMPSPVVVEDTPPPRAG